MGKAGSHNLTDGMKKLLDVFGIEWRMVSMVGHLHFLA
jgi:Holliday junction resolvase YEN1